MEKNEQLKCRDGDTCHHRCKSSGYEACFREQTCSPLSDYHGEWGKPDITEGDYNFLGCPYCADGISELWEYSNNFEDDEGDSVQCYNCSREFIVKRSEDRVILEGHPMVDGYANAKERFNKYREDFRRLLKDHITEPVELGEKIQAYYLKKPSIGRMMSTLIIFSGEGITFIGDLVPNHHGCNSSFRYEYWWFIRKLSDSYLCEKFPDVRYLSRDHAMLCAIQEAFARGEKKRNG